MSRDATAYVPTRPSLKRLREAAQKCRGCGLYENATQAVLGEGSADAAIVLLGEQPGDQEDRQGKPFVGPAGGLLEKALGEAGIDPARTYRTNVVKHFKYGEVRGKRRIHETPNRTEIQACRPWLLAEMALLHPTVLVCLGATAAKAILGPSFRVTKERGMVLDCPALTDDDTDHEVAMPDVVVATIHPSAVLRAKDRQQAYDGFVADLEVVARVEKEGD